MRGVVAVIFGVLTLLHPAITLALLVLFFGTYAFVDGILAVLAECLALGLVVIAANCSNRTGSNEASIKLDSLPRIATIDPRYQSYNVEIAEVVGGNFWKPYTAQSIAQMTRKGGASSGTGVVGEDTTMFQARPPVDLTNPRLRKLAMALGPAYVRVSGSWMNSVYFHDSDSPAPTKAPKGFQGVLTRAQWKGVIDFAQAVNAKLVTSFAISAGVRDAKGIWTPVQARKLLAYTKTIGGEIAAAEMFNEPDMPVYGGAPPGYSAANYARDFAVFLPFVRSAAPAMKAVGPGSVGEGVLMPLMGGAGLASGLVKTEDMLSASPKPEFRYLLLSFLRVCVDPLRVHGRRRANDARLSAHRTMARAD